MVLLTQRRILTHPSVRGRPHYYSTKKEEYASIKFDLSTDFSSLMAWNTKSIYLSVAAVWDSPCCPQSPCADRFATNTTNEAVIYDTVLTSPSADHLTTIATLSHISKKEKREAIVKASKEGDTTGKSRGVLKLRNQKPKYTITAPGGNVGGLEDVRLVVRYNVQPWVGALAFDQRGNWGVWKAVEGGVSSAFSLPHVRNKTREGVAKA